MQYTVFFCVIINIFAQEFFRSYHFSSGRNTSNRFSFEKKNQQQKRDPLGKNNFLIQEDLVRYRNEADSDSFLHESDLLVNKLDRSINQVHADSHRPDPYEFFQEISSDEHGVLMTASMKKGLDFPNEPGPKSTSGSKSSFRSFVRSGDWGGSEDRTKRVVTVDAPSPSITRLSRFGGGTAAISTVLNLSEVGEVVKLFAPVDHSSGDSVFETEDSVFEAARQNLDSVVLATIDKIPGTDAPNAREITTSGQPTQAPTVSCSYMGYYWSNQNQSCVACEAGSYAYSTVKIVSCTPCPAGTYSDSDGSTSCSDCSGGKYQSDIGQSSCNVCSAGKYTEGSGSANCTYCGVGKYIEDDGEDSREHLSKKDCDDCDTGLISNDDFSGCEYCPSGSEGSSDYVCVACEQGYYSNAHTGFMCSACDAGYAINNITGATNCTICGVGTYSAAAGDMICTKCKPGRHQDSEGGTKCYACDAGYYAKDYGSTSCTSCSAYHESDRASAICDRCEEDYYFSRNESCTIPGNGTFGQPWLTCEGSCTACDLISEHKIKCPNGTTLENIVLRKGFWRSSAMSTKIKPCYPSSNCVGGRVVGEYCDNKINQHSPQCSICAQGYFRRNPWEVCHSCTRYTIGHEEKFLLGLIFVTFVSYVLLQLSSKEGVLFRIKKRWLKKHKHGARGMQKRLLNKFKIMFVGLQTVTCAVSDLDVPFPNGILVFCHTVEGAINMKFSKFFPIQCFKHEHSTKYIGRHLYSYDLVISTLYPIAGCLLFAAYFNMRQWFTKDPVRKHKFKASLWYCITFLLFLSLPATSNIVLGTFHVEDTGGNDAPHDIYLAADYSTRADSRIYKAFMVPYAVAFFFVYPLGVPLAFFCLMWRKRDKIDPLIDVPVDTRGFVISSGVGTRLSFRDHGRRIEEWEALYRAIDIRECDPHFEISHLTFLIDTYEPEYWYWEVIQCIYRVVVMNIHVFSGQYDVVAAFLVAASYGKYVSLVEPYIYDSDDTLADLTQAVICLILLLGFTVKYIGPSDAFTYIFMGLLSLSFAYMVLLIILEFRGFFPDLEDAAMVQHEFVRAMHIKAADTNDEERENYESSVPKTRLPKKRGFEGKRASRYERSIALDFNPTGNEYIKEIFEGIEPDVSDL